jgi:dipeptidyl aminopeptidase/acylaminoacyl peptidase
LFFDLSERSGTERGGSDSENDSGNLVEETRKIFRAAMRLGKSAQLATYPGEGHSMLYWSRPNAMDGYERIMSFLDRYLED